MAFIRSWAVILLAPIALIGCASAPNPINYYSFNTEGLLAVPSVESPIIVIDRVTLAEYLLESNLVLKVGPNQLQFAENHRWAGPVDSALVARLINHLNASGSGVFIGSADPRSVSADFSLQLDIQNLIASDDGSVVAAGRYWVAAAGGELLAAHTFNFSAELRQDGFASAVLAMGELIDQIAAEISAREFFQ